MAIMLILTLGIYRTWSPMTVELCPYGAGDDEGALVVALDECGNYRDLEGHTIYAETIAAMLADRAGDYRVHIDFTNEQDTSVPTVALALSRLYRITSSDKPVRVTIHLKCLR